jgi:hypothetical protein
METAGCLAEPLVQQLPEARPESAAHRRLLRSMLMPRALAMPRQAIADRFGEQPGLVSKALQALVEADPRV